VLPSNLILSEDVKRIFERVWRKSPTLRDQCRRIARAPWARIRLCFVVKTSDRYYALTTRTRYVDGPVTITVRIFVTGRYVEVLGHELEHVLEQIEGLDLEAQALKECSGVFRDENGFYETKRAVNAGRKVYTEYRGAKMVGNAEEAASPCSAEEFYLREVRNRGEAP
jgi:hypothetical protein